MINELFQNPITGTGTKDEQDLVESLVIELIQISGTNWQYLPRTIYDTDKVLHEDPNSTFEKAYTIEMYLQNAIAYGGQGYLLSKFGVETNETVELLLSRKRFKQETGQTNPKEGDLLYHPVYKALFEINFIDYDITPAFYQLAKNHVWLIKASFMSYSYETLDTGIKQIDDEFDPDTFVDPFANNKDLNSEASDILNYDDPNVFGDITFDEES